MFCTRKVNDDYTWVGADGRRLAMFEGVYDVPRGVSFNSYLLTDGKTVLFDTADASVCRVFLENVAHGLNGRALDYLVVQHMEPPISGTCWCGTRRPPWCAPPPPRICWPSSSAPGTRGASAW